jgi:hypothetical protein
MNEIEDLVMAVWDQTTGPKLSDKGPQITNANAFFGPEIYASWRERGSPTERSEARKAFLSALRVALAKERP